LEDERGICGEELLSSSANSFFQWLDILEIGQVEKARIRCAVSLEDLVFMLVALVLDELSKGSDLGPSLRIKPLQLQRMLACEPSSDPGRIESMKIDFHAMPFVVGIIVAFLLAGNC